MNTIELSLSAENRARLGLKEDADEAAFVGALQGVMNKNADLQNRVNSLTTEKTQLQVKIDTLEAAACQKEVDNMLADAQEKRLITNELKAQLATDYKGNPEALKKVLAAIRPTANVVDALTPENAGNDAEKAELAKMDWDAIDKKELTATLRNSYPDLYKEKFKKKFGKEPSL